jgi:hypothetical protein
MPLCSRHSIMPSINHFVLKENSRANQDQGRPISLVSLNLPRRDSNTHKVNNHEETQYMNSLSVLYSSADALVPTTTHGNDVFAQLWRSPPAGTHCYQRHHNADRGASRRPEIKTSSAWERALRQTMWVATAARPLHTERESRGRSMPNVTVWVFDVFRYYKRGREREKICASAFSVMVKRLCCEYHALSYPAMLTLYLSLMKSVKRRKEKRRIHWIS